MKAYFDSEVSLIFLYNLRLFQEKMIICFIIDSFYKEMTEQYSTKLAEVADQIRIALNVSLTAQYLLCSSLNQLDKLRPGSCSPRELYALSEKLSSAFPCFLQFSHFLRPATKVGVGKLLGL